MRKLTKNYFIYLAIAYLLFIVLILVLVNSEVSLPVFLTAMYSVMGLAMLYWGLYYRKNAEAYDVTLTINFFIRKKELGYYDARRMVKDMGTSMIAMSVPFLACILLYGITERLEFMGAGIAALIVGVTAFMVVCRKSKYLKDPAVRPPKRTTGNQA